MRWILVSVDLHNGVMFRSTLSVLCTMNCILILVTFEIQADTLSTHILTVIAYTLKTEMIKLTFKRAEEWPLFLHVVFNIQHIAGSSWIKCWISCGKSGHSSALLNVNLTFQFLECTQFWGFNSNFQRDHARGNFNTKAHMPHGNLKNAKITRIDESLIHVYP